MGGLEAVGGLETSGDVEPGSKYMNNMEAKCDVVVLASSTNLNQIPRHLESNDHTPQSGGGQKVDHTPQSGGGQKADHTPQSGGGQKADHTPQSGDPEHGKQRSGGSVSGILKHVSQFDTPSSAVRTSGGRRVQFANKPDYKEAETDTPKQGGCGLEGCVPGACHFVL